jgi:hypothetical protein
MARVTPEREFVRDRPAGTIRPRSAGLQLGQGIVNDLSCHRYKYAKNRRQHMGMRHEQGSDFAGYRQASPAAGIVIGLDQSKGRNAP